MKKQSIINQILHNNFFQGGIFLSGSYFVSGFINYFFNILTARVMGPEGYGDITAFFSYMIILSTPIGILTVYVILKIGKQADPYWYAHSILLWVFGRLKRWWFLGIPLLFLIPFLPSITNISPIVAYSIIPILLINYILAFYEGLVQALHLMFLMALLGMSFALIKLIGPVIALTTVPDISIIILFIGLSYSAKLIGSHVVLQKVFQQHHTKVKVMKKRILDVIKDRGLWFTAISSISLAFLSNIDIIFVKKFFTAEIAGIYSSWNLFAKIIIFVLGAFISVSFLFFSSKKYETYHKLVFIGSLISITFCGFISMLVYGFYGRFIIDLLFGSRFYPVYPFLEWASFYGTAYVMVIFMNNYYLAKGSKQAYIIAATLPIYIAALFLFGHELADVMMINIWYFFGLIGIYLLIFFKDKFVSLFQD